MGPESILTTKAAVESIVDEWRRLALDSPAISYFSSPDWILSWWENFGSEDQLEMAVWRGGDEELQAVVALSSFRERLHPRIPAAISGYTNLGSGAGAADHNGFPVLPELVAEVKKWLNKRATNQSLLLRNLDASMSQLIPDRARLVGISRCPRLELGNNGNVGVSSKFRKKLRYYARRLENEGVEFHWIEPPRMNSSLLRTVFDLHDRRRSLTQGTSSFLPSRLPFHQSLVKRAAEGRGPAVVVAELNSQVIGVLYGFLWNGVFSYYQSGWDPGWAHLNIGTALTAEAIRLLNDAGAKVFDFLRGEEDYKYRFGATDRVDQSWLVPAGVSGRLLQLKHGVKRRSI